ncbi:hypothetical protein ILYODFUR_001739 [Ilyodon furcidens]|uniref:Uncharacterized protein n=1 Tax=Ilyodon furcidens TaxID=33524 RepID=A0ABV0UFB4_9TELE
MEASEILHTLIIAICHIVQLYLKGSSKQQKSRIWWLMVESAAYIHFKKETRSFKDGKLNFKIADSLILLSIKKAERSSNHHAEAERPGQPRPAHCPIDPQRH